MRCLRNITQVENIPIYLRNLLTEYELSQEQIESLMNIGNIENMIRHAQGLANFGSQELVRSGGWAEMFAGDKVSADMAELISNGSIIQFCQLIMLLTYITTSEERKPEAGAIPSRDHP